MSFWRRDEDEAFDHQGWELHPCSLPTPKALGKFSPPVILGNVWICPCGRRYQLTELRTQTDLYGTVKVVDAKFEERFDLTDDDVEQLLNQELS